MCVSIKRRNNESAVSEGVSGSLGGAAAPQHPSTASFLTGCFQLLGEEGGGDSSACPKGAFCPQPCPRGRKGWAPPQTLQSLPGPRGCSGSPPAEGPPQAPGKSSGARGSGEAPWGQAGVQRRASLCPWRGTRCRSWSGKSKSHPRLLLSDVRRFPTAWTWSVRALAPLAGDTLRLSAP